MKEIKKYMYDKLPYEVTDEDRDFFDDLVNRTPDGDLIGFEDLINEEVVKKEIVLKEEESEFPDWYRPWMKVSWVNGVPIRPPTKEELSSGNWV